MQEVSGSIPLGSTKSFSIRSEVSQLPLKFSQTDKAFLRCSQTFNDSSESAPHDDFVIRQGNS
jgi:hypothetical protein